MLGPAGDFGLDAFGFELFGDDRNHLVDIFFPVGLFLGDVALELVVDLRVQMLKREIFESRS